MPNTIVYHLIMLANRIVVCFSLKWDLIIFWNETTSRTLAVGDQSVHTFLEPKTLRAAALAPIYFIVLRSLFAERKADCKTKDDHRLGADDVN